MSGTTNHGDARGSISNMFWAFLRTSSSGANTRVQPLHQKQAPNTGRVTQARVLLERIERGFDFDRYAIRRHPFRALRRDLGDRPISVQDGRGRRWIGEFVGGGFIFVRQHSKVRVEMMGQFEDQTRVELEQLQQRLMQRARHDDMA